MASALAVPLASMLAPSATMAANKYWDIDGATPEAGGAAPAGTWDTVITNWTTDSTGSSAATTWAAGDTAIFAAGTTATGSYTVTLGAGQSAVGVTTEEGTVLLTGSTLSLTGGAALNIAPGLTTTIGSVLAGTAGYNISGGGTVALTNAGNSVSGAVSVTGGSTLQITTSSQIGSTSAGAGAVTLNNGTFRNMNTGVGGTFLTANRGVVIAAGGGTIDVPGAATTIQIYTSGTITGGGVLTKSGVGTFRLTTPTAAPTFNKMVVTGGLYQANLDVNFGPVPTSVVTDYFSFDNGGGISANGGFTWVANRGLVLNSGGGRLDASSAAIFAGPISGPGNLTITKSTTNTITLSNTGNSYGGSTLVTTGSLIVTGGSAIPDASAVVLNGGTGTASFQINADETIGSLAGGSATNGLVTLNGASRQLTLGGNNSSTTYAGQWAGTTGRITKEGTGVFSLAGFEPVVTGITLINNGAIRLANASAGLNNSSTVSIQAAGTYDMNTFNDTIGSLTGSGVIVNGGNLTIGGTAGNTFTGTMTLAGNLVKSNTGTLVLTGNNSIGTNINITAGIFTLAGANTVGGAVNITGSGTLAASSGRINFNNDGAVGAATVNVTGPGAEISNTAVGITTVNAINLNDAANPVQIQSTSGNSWNITGTIGGVGSLIRDNDGAGSLVLSGTNNFAGGLLITNRNIGAGSKDAFGTGTLTIGDVVAPTTAISFFANVPLTGANAIANAIVLNQNFGVSGANDLEFTSAINLGNINRSFNITNTGATILSGVISGDPTVGFVKTGGGNLHLTNAGNSYPGDTAIAAGTLSANGDGALGVGGQISLAGGTLASLSAINTSRNVSVSAASGLDATGGAISLQGSGNTTLGGDLAISGGTVNLARTGGTTSVTPGVTVTINPGATLVNGGSVDSLSDGVNHANVTNNSVTTFNIPAGVSRNIGNLQGVGRTNIAATGALTANHARQAQVDVDGTLTIRANGGNAGTSVVAALNIAGSNDAWTGKVNLDDNDLILSNGGGVGSGAAGAAVTARTTNQIKQGANVTGVKWDGSGGFVSTAAAAETRTALGVIQNNSQSASSITSATSNGTTLDETPANAVYTTFGGENVSVNDTLVKYTWFGDADLSGTINSTDYNLIDAGFNNNSSGWVNGDFDYSGSITSTDYFLIDSVFISQGGSLSSAMLSQRAASFGQGYVDAINALPSVPEPSALGLLAVGAAGLLNKRRPRARSASTASLSGEKDAGSKSNQHERVGFMSKFFRKSASLALGGILVAGAFCGFGSSSANAALTFDIKATLVNGNPWGGDPHAVQAGLGDIVTYEVCAMISDGNTNMLDEGFQSGEGRILSITTGGIKGNLAHSLTAPFNANSSLVGASQDIDGDTDLDIGGLTNLAGGDAGRVVYRAATLQTNNPMACFVVGGGTFTVTDMGDGSQTDITFQTAGMNGFNSNPLWQEDGGQKTQSNGVLASAPLVVTPVPEPAALSLLAMGLLAGLKRRTRRA